MEKKTVVSSQESIVKEAKAYGRYLHIAPTKIQDLMRLVRGKTVAEAETILKFSGRKGGEVALKVLRSAEANAGPGFEKSSWVVTDARANKGPLYRRRVNPRARGSADFLRSPSTHISIAISEKQKGKESEKMVSKQMEKSATESPDVKVGVPTGASGEVKHGPQT